MFSKLFKSAKTVLQPVAPAALQYPETDLFPSTPAPRIPAHANMVTTQNRARAGLDPDTELATPTVKMQGSSRNRQRRDATSTPVAVGRVLESSSSSKKRGLTAQSSRESTITNMHTRSEIQLPVREVIDLDSTEEEDGPTEPSPKKPRLSGIHNGKKVAEQQDNFEIGKLSSKKSTISLLSDSEEELEHKVSSAQQIQSLIPEDEEGRELAPKASSSQQIQSLLSDDEVEQPKDVEKRTPFTPFLARKSASTSEMPNDGKKRKSPKIDQKAAKENVELPKPKHRRFGSEEPIVEIPSSDPIDNDNIEESEESGSDDEAPEEVGTREAAEDAKKSIRAAAKVVENLRATQRKARQDRDLALKKQAELNKKRKRKGKSAPEVKQDDQSKDVEQTDVNDITTIDAPETTASGLLTKKSTLQKIDEHNLPDLLPLEYLEDTVNESTTLTQTESTQPRPKKTKFLDLAEKKAKDKRKGSTTYRVIENKQNARLAPKASKTSMSLKEAWLNGGVRKGGKGGSGILRKPMKSSFFVNGKSGAGRR